MNSADPGSQSGRAEDPAAYVPLDRRQALAAGIDLPEHTYGSALFADISGFTALTARLTRTLGLRRGAEELPRHLDRVYHGLITRVQAHGGSVISFSGDAITCWLEGDDGRRAAACAWQLQDAMQEFSAVPLPDGSTAALTLKVAVATGPVRRLVVGSPELQLIDVIAGGTLDRLAEAEGVAGSGEIVVDRETARHLPHVSWRDGFAVLTGPPPEVPTVSPDMPTGQDLRAWLLPEVTERLAAGQVELLTELRPVTALFVGFSGIDYDTDPEAGIKLDAFIRRVQSEASRLEGSLLQLTVGDKGSYLYVAFGAPVSHEDDPRRAVTVAMRLQELAAEFPFLTGVRMGLSHGTMRTGAYGGMTRRTYGALGNETNMAARLMSLAADGQILATEAVLPGSGFSWRALAPVTVKGRSQPLDIFEPVAEEAPVAEAHDSPLVGREAELMQLRGSLHQAKAGRGRTVYVTGDAGIGKSRLVAAVAAEAHGFRVLRGESESFRADLPYQLWRRMFMDLLGPDPLKALPPDLYPRLPLLGPVLDLAIPDNSMTASLDPELRKEAREALLSELVRREATDRPLLLILENAQWADSLSRDLLAAISRLAPGLPLLILVTSRDAADGDLRLGPLPEEDARELLRSRHALDPALQQRLLAQAEGNPYYLEQLLTWVHEGGHDSELPGSLHSLVLSRIDRLTEHQKATLKAASIIGRRFGLDMLQGYYPALGGAGRVEAEAKALERLELLGQEPPEWAFAQLVTRDVTYGSIPFAVRASLHGRLARHIEAHFASQSEPMLDLLALHYGASDDEAKQREYLLRAGIAAQDSYANETALRWFGQLLPLLSAAERPAVLLRLGQVQMHLGTYDEARASLQGALEQAATDLEAVRAMRLLGELREKQGDYDSATDWLERARDRLEALTEPAELIQVLLAEGGNVLWQLGQYGLARERLQAALELARELADERSMARALHGLGNLDLYQGKLQAARDLFQASLVIRRRIGDSLGIANALNNLGIIAASLEGNARARELFQGSLEIRRAIGDRAGTAVALNNVGFMAASDGLLAEAEAMYRDSLQLRREIGDQLGTAVTLNSLGQLYLRQERTPDAAASYRESLQLAHQIGNVREVASAVAGAAAVAVAGRPVLAVSLASLAEVLLESIGAVAEPEVREVLDSVLESARLAAGAVESAVARGRQLDPGRGVERALQVLSDLTIPAE